MSKKPSKVKDAEYRAKCEEVKHKSPLHKLLFIMSVAPRDVQNFIQMHVMEIIEIELAKYQQVASGLKLDPAGDDSVVTMFEETIGQMKDMGILNKEVDATVVDCMTNVAAEIDKGVKRVMLGDPIKNVGAYLDLVSCHAKMVASLAHIMEPIDGKDNGDSA